MSGREDADQMEVEFPGPGGAGGDLFHVLLTFMKDFSRHWRKILAARSCCTILRVT